MIFWKFLTTLKPEAYSGPNRICKMELLVKILNGYRSYFWKIYSISDVRLGFEYTSENLQSNSKITNLKWDWFSIAVQITRRCSIIKTVLKNFTRFTGKHLRWRPDLSHVCNYFIKSASSFVLTCEFRNVFQNS